MVHFPAAFSAFIACALFFIPAEKKAWKMNHPVRNNLTTLGDMRSAKQNLYVLKASGEALINRLRIAM